MNRNLLITGASTGVGQALAVLAAKAGWTVHATMRNTAKREALDAAAQAAGVEVQVRQLDVTDPASVTRCVAEVIEADGRLDALVANAGIGYVRSTEQANEADIARVMDTNFMGVVRLVKAALPHMRKAGAGRLVAISSVGGLVGQPFNEVYCASKFALEGYFEGLASYVGPSFGLEFSLVEPGGIASEFATSALAQVEATGGLLQDDYLPILQEYMATVQGRAGGDLYQTADQVAQVVLDTLEADRPPLRVRTSAWAEEFSALKTQADPDGLKLRDRVLREMLGREV
ncbi:SDR family oxidoreductase [Halovulum sp. GXIMD14794]